MRSVLSFFGAGRVLFGTDWPHASDPGVAYFTGRYDEIQLSADNRRAIDCDNAKARCPAVQS